MVAGADGDAVAVEDLGDVVGVDALDLEGDRADPLRAARGAEDRQAGDLGDPGQGVVGDLLLVGEHGVHAEAVEPAQGRGHADRLGDRRRPRLEAGRRVGVGGPGAGHLADHRAPAKEGGHLTQQL